MNEHFKEVLPDKDNFRETSHHLGKIEEKIEGIEEKLEKVEKKAQEAKTLAQKNRINS